MRKLLPALIMLSACKKVDPAPKDLDGLFHWFWGQYDDGLDADLAEGARNLHDAVDGDAIDKVEDGSITDLSEEEAALVGVSRDPGKGAGLYLVNAFQCDIGDLAEILADLDQNGIYDGNYDSYDRVYTSDYDAFASGDEPKVTWDVDYSATIMGNSYDASIEGGLRRVPDLGSDDSPFGPVLLARTVMPTPADFESSEWNLVQDYQLEIFYERSKNTIVHAYAIWRQGEYGTWGDMDNESIQRIVLNSLADWDDQTEKVCVDW